MFSLGGMMGMIGGTPTTPSKDVIANKLKVAKTLQMGDTSDSQLSNLTKGLQGLLKNPMQQKGGGAKGAAQQGSDQLTTRDVEQTKLAIDDTLIPAIDAILAESDRIVGRDNGGTGLLDTVSMIQTLDGISAAAPQYAQEVVLKPALTDAEMDVIAAELPRIVEDVATRSTSDVSGRVQVLLLAQPLIDILNASDAAKAAAQEHAVYLASVAAAGALLSAGSPEWQAIMAKAFQDEDAARIRHANAVFLAPDEDAIPPFNPASSS